MKITKSSQGDVSELNVETHVERKREIVRLAVLIGSMAITGLMMPRAVVYGGLSPFCIGACACVPSPYTALMALFSAVGYFMCADIVLPLRYMASLVVIVALRWALGGVKKITDRIWYTPLVTFVSLIITGIAVGATNGIGTDVALALVCEALVGAGFSYFCYVAYRVAEGSSRTGGLTVGEQASLIIVVAVLLMALNGIMISDISFGRIFTIVIILLAAKAGQQQGGMLAGVVLGATTALAMPSYAYAALSFAFGGLIAGLFSRFGRLAIGGLFLLVHTLVLLASGDLQTVVIGMYESFAAAVLFLVVPVAAERGANVLFCRARSEPAVEGLRSSLEMRLQYAAGTIKDIADTVDAVSEKLAAMDTPHINSVYSEVCEHLCNGCARRGVCWEERFADTMQQFRQMGDVLREKGRITAKDIPSAFSAVCRHHDEVIAALNSGYARLVAKERAYARLADMRGIVTDQFEGMASLLEEFATDFHHTERADEQTAARIEAVCARYRLPLVNAVCLIGRRDRIVVELLMEGENIPDESTRWHKELCDACGCVLDKPTVTKNGFYTKIRLTEKPRLAVRFASAQLNCKAEKLCGDAFEYFYDNNGRYCVVLSDGMGSGGRAAVDGAMAAALTARMLQAGFHYDNIVRIINSSLLVKSKEESLATLDAVQIDLFDGYVQGFKAGAAPAFLYSRGHVCKIAVSSLPIGILRQVDARPYEEYVDKGDVLVLVSDGVVSDDSTWLEEMIVRLAKSGASEKSIASEIVFYAREQQKEHTDDTTALVMRIA